MEDPFLAATSDLDKILDEFEESETPKAPKKNSSLEKKKEIPSPSSISQTANSDNFNDVASNTNSEASYKPTSTVDSSEALNLSQTTTDLLIDFSAPSIPSTTTNEIKHETLKDLDFLLSFEPTQTNSLNKVPDKSSNPIVKNVLDDEPIEKCDESNKVVDSDHSNDVPNYSKISTKLDSVPEVNNHMPKQNEQHDDPVNEVVVGFSENVKVDDTEFLKFMEESISGLDRLSENCEDDSQKSDSTPHLLDADLPNQSVSPATSEESSSDVNIASVSEVNSHAQVTASESSQATTNSPDLSTTRNRPKLKKIFHKDIVASQTSSNSLNNRRASPIPQASPESENTNHGIRVPNHANSPSSASLNSPAHSTSQTLSTSVCNPVASPVAAVSPQQDQARPSSLPGTLRDERNVQRIPSVSPPSYSSVIAGDYSAGTIVQQDPSMSYSTNSGERQTQHFPHTTPMVTATGVQGDSGERIEHGIEITEDASQNIMQDLQTAPEDNSNAARSLQAIPPRLLQRPGHTKPHWVPDEDSPACTKCKAKFTFTKRRHHCRACGRVFCSSCCGEKSKLAYLDYTEARVCIFCYTAILQADALASSSIPQNTSDLLPAPQALPLSSSPTAGSSPRPVLRNGDESGENGATKSVRFVDGTRPDHPAVLPDTPPLPTRASRAKRLKQRTENGQSSRSLLPPVVIEHSDDGTFAVDEDPDPAPMATLLKSDPDNPICFSLGANLFVFLKFVSYNSTLCYYFVSLGLDSVGQSEVALLLQIDPADDSIPNQAFGLYTHLFNSARKGKAVHANDFMLTKDFMGSSETLFGSNDYAGLLFVRRTCQNVENLSTDAAAERLMLKSGTVQFSSTLFALLVRKAEVQWATLFCSRLLLRLGAEYKQFPYPLINMHDRPAVYYEVGNTILGILCDFRNYKYRVVSVPGISAVVNKNGVIISMPCNRFADIVKIINSSNEHVVAFGSNTFLSDDGCTSHLVCIQDAQDHNYHTEVMTSVAVEEEIDSSAGSAFIVFNGSLKSGNTQQAKCTVVEDGVMVQLLPEKMAVLKESLKAMEDFKLNCSQHFMTSSQHHTSDDTEKDALPTNAADNQASSQCVEVRWVPDDTKFNIGLSSPIDFRSFEGVDGYNVQGKSEKKGKKLVLRWNQVFFFKSTSDIMDMSRLAERVANGCFQALVPHLKLLRDSSQMKIGIRINIHPDDVGYAVGSCGLPLPDGCLNALDDNLIPIVHDASSNLQPEDDPVIFELIFSVLEIRSGWTTVNK